MWDTHSKRTMRTRARGDLSHEFLWHPLCFGMFVVLFSVPMSMNDNREGFRAFVAVSAQHFALFERSVSRSEDAASLQNAVDRRWRQQIRKRACRLVDIGTGKGSLRRFLTTPTAHDRSEPNLIYYIYGGKNYVQLL